ncbi:MAG: dihydrodipicolinate synthase family protein, partial [Pseudomonadota bacterium]
MSHQLHGVIAPFTTPFGEDDEVRLDDIGPQVDWMIGEGVHGLAAGGSTGEGHALGRAEHLSVLRETVDAADGRVPVVAGVISDSTRETALRSEAAAGLGVAALQITPPHYLFKPDLPSMIGHFREVHAAAGLPILIYNVVPWCYLSPDDL